MLHDTNLTQHVNFPTHDPGSHTLDLVITSTDSSLNPAVTRANTQPSDHFPVFSYLNLSPNLPPPPQSYTFRRLNSIDHTSFLDDYYYLPEMYSPYRRLATAEPTVPTAPPMTLPIPNPNLTLTLKLTLTRTLFF